MKNKYTTIGVIIVTILLAGVAIFTALKLYQTRNTAVAPNVPSSKPRAAVDEPTIAPTLAPVVNTCVLSFALTTNTSTPTATATSTSSATPTATSTATATATTTPNPQCNNSCTSNSNCPSGLMCYIANGATTGNCRNTQCLSETDCTCATVTGTPTAVPSQPSLPNAGTTWPTMLATGFGIIVIIGSLLLAL